MKKPHQQKISNSHGVLDEVRCSGKRKNGWISIQGGPRKTSYKLSYGAPITSMVISPQENTFKYRAIYRNNFLQWIGSVTRRCPSHLKWWRQLCSGLTRHQSLLHQISRVRVGDHEEARGLRGFGTVKPLEVELEDVSTAQSSPAATKC